MLRPFIEKAESFQDLTLEEAEQALNLILNEDVSNEDITRLLVSLSEKGEAPHEIAGFARVMRRHARRIANPHPISIDTAGTGGGGDTFNISTAATFVVSGAGIPVAKHGNRAITSRSGSADVLEHLGVPVEVSQKTVERSLAEIGICFMFAPGFHPAMKRVAGIRRQLKRRTIFNLLGPLTNPAGTPFQLIGVYEPELTSRLAAALCHLGCRRAWIVHSEDGLDELSISARTQIAEVANGAVTNFRFKPIETKLGIPKGGTPQENARLILGILEGKIQGPGREVVALNAAGALHVAGEKSFSAAMERAHQSIDSGAALKKLQQLSEIYGAPDATD